MSHVFNCLPELILQSLNSMLLVKFRLWLPLRISKIPCRIIRVEQQHKVCVLDLVQLEDFHFD